MVSYFFQFSNGNFCCIIIPLCSLEEFFEETERRDEVEKVVGLYRISTFQWTTRERSCSLLFCVDVIVVSTDCFRGGKPCNELPIASR